MELIAIKPAEESDLGAIIEFLVSQFFETEPVNSFHIANEPHEYDKAGLLKKIQMGTILKAVDTTNNKFAGFMIAEVNEPGDEKILLERARTCITKRKADILTFLAHIEAKNDICNRYQIPQCLFLSMCGVDIEYQNQGIARRLFERSLDLAKEKGFPLVAVDCTSYYTIKIAEHLKMKCISSITFDEYNELIGERMFIAQEPHKIIKTFIKRIE